MGNGVSPNEDVQIDRWNARSIRRQVTRLVREDTSAEVLFYMYASVGEHLAYTSILTSSGLEPIEKLEGLRAAPDSIIRRTSYRSWSVSRPSELQHNRFSTFEEDYGSVDAIRGQPTFDNFYAPHEITDQARALMFDGEQFLGFLGAIRQGGEKFDPRTLSRLRQKTEVYRRLLVLACTAQQNDTVGAMHLIADEYGAVLHADERAATWLTTRRRDHIKRVVSTSLRFAVDGFKVSSCWLDDGSRKLRHIALSSAPTLRVSAWNHLSKTQRDIASLAIEGLTNREIARLQGISESTVKYHLRRILESTGTSSRSELGAIRAQHHARTSSGD